MLFFKELKKVIFSIPYVIFLAGFIIMIASQNVISFNLDDKINMPVQGKNDYGYKDEGSPEKVMPAALNSLYTSFLTNSYTTYPIGFYKNVRLSDEEQKAVAEILEALTGRDLQQFYEDYQAVSKGAGSAGAEALSIKRGLSYEAFVTQMDLADRMLGGGSSYAPESLPSFGRTPMTYEDAVKSYELVRDKDKFTGAYARLFSDYSVIVLSVLPVFLSVALCLRDRRLNISQIIYTRSMCSGKIILLRYGAVVISALAPVLLFAYISNISVWGMYDGAVLDYLAPLKYTLGWLLPSVMISAAVGMFFTELTGTPAAIFLQGLWWFIDINTGIRIKGAYPLYLLAPRHNNLEKTAHFNEYFQSLVLNRLFFAAAAAALVLCTVMIYEMKRKGRLKSYEGFKGFKIRKEKSVSDYCL